MNVLHLNNFQSYKPVPGMQLQLDLHGQQIRELMQLPEPQGNPFLHTLTAAPSANTSTHMHASQFSATYHLRNFGGWKGRPSVVPSSMWVGTVSNTVVWAAGSSFRFLATAGLHAYPGIDCCCAGSSAAQELHSSC